MDIKDYRLREIVLLYFIHNGIEFGSGFGTKHTDTSLAEVGDALEERTGCEMTTNMKDAATLIESVYGCLNLLTKDIHFPMVIH